MQGITQETIEILMELFKKTVGEKGIKILLTRTSEGVSGRKLVYEIASMAMEIYGKKEAMLLCVSWEEIWQNP